MGCHPGRGRGEDHVDSVERLEKLRSEITAILLGAHMHHGRQGKAQFNLLTSERGVVGGPFVEPPGVDGTGFRGDHAEQRAISQGQIGDGHYAKTGSSGPQLDASLDKRRTYRRLHLRPFKMLSQDAKAHLGQVNCGQLFQWAHPHGTQQIGRILTIARQGTGMIK